MSGKINNILFIIINLLCLFKVFYYLYEFVIQLTWAWYHYA